MLLYQYKPVQQSDSIRILVLHPSSKNSDPILCSIRHTRISDACLRYEALSYTWGDATQKSAIYFEDGSRELFVTKNCYNALRRLRYEDEERLLWIDAICINQDDLEERSSQVRMMDEIYKRAFRVMVFLGEPRTSSSMLFEELAAADKELSRTGRCDRPPPSDIMVRELEELFENPWFKRVWVLQEVFAKTSVGFICGPASFSYKSLESLYFGYNSQTVITKEFWPLTTKWISQQPEEFSTPQFSLWNRLGESRNYLATDPKDRVFALKSVIGSGQSQMDRLINYAQSVEECYTDVATFLLPVLGLRLLTAARHPHQRNMSSWIPDWSQTLPLHRWNFNLEFPEISQPASRTQKHKIRSFLGKLLEIRPELRVISRRSSLHSAHSEKQRHKTQFLLNKLDQTHLELHVVGCRYARVRYRSQVFQFSNIADARSQMEMLYYCLGNLRHLVSAEKMLYDDPTMPLHLGEAVLGAMASMNGEQLDRHIRHRSILLADRDLFSDTEFMRDLFASLQQCRISLMDNDEIVIVPEAVQLGDTICIISEALSPCALRQSSDGSWTVISGDCYIFTEKIRVDNEFAFFMCDDYLAHNQDSIEEFRLR